MTNSEKGILALLVAAGAGAVLLSGEGTANAAAPTIPGASPPPPPSTGSGIVEVGQSTLPDGSVAIVYDQNGTRYVQVQAATSNTVLFDDTTAAFRSWYAARFPAAPTPPAITTTTAPPAPPPPPPPPPPPNGGGYTPPAPPPPPPPPPGQTAEQYNAQVRAANPTEWAATCRILRANGLTLTSGDPADATFTAALTRFQQGYPGVALNYSWWQPRTLTADGRLGAHTWQALQNLDYPDTRTPPTTGGGTPTPGGSGGYDLTSAVAYNSSVRSSNNADFVGAVQVLRALGHQLTNALPPVSDERFASALRSFQAAYNALDAPRHTEWQPRSVTEDGKLGPHTLSALRHYYEYARNAGYNVEDIDGFGPPARSVAPRRF